MIDNSKNIKERVAVIVSLATFLPSVAADESSSTALSLLGPNVLATIALALGGIQSISCYTMPSATLNGYGWSPTPETLAAVTAAGINGLSTSVMHYQLYVNDSSLITALVSGIAIRLMLNTFDVIRDYLEPNELEPFSGWD